MTIIPMCTGQHSKGHQCSCAHSPPSGPSPLPSCCGIAYGGSSFRGGWLGPEPSYGRFRLSGSMRLARGPSVETVLPAGLLVLGWLAGLLLLGCPSSSLTLALEVTMQGRQQVSVWMLCCRCTQQAASSLLTLLHPWWHQEGPVGLARPSAPANAPSASTGPTCTR